MSPRPALLPLLAVLLALGWAGPAQARPLAQHDHRDTVGEIQVDLAAAVERADATGPATRAFSDPVQGLPTTWCGTARTTDDVTDAAQPATQPRFKLVYAYAAGQPNRFAAWADGLQGSVSIIGRFMGSSTKAPRWDMGTSCGPGYVDIQTVALSSAREAYVGNFGALRSEVQSQLGATSAKRNFIVFADGLTDGGTFGLGEAYNSVSSGSDLPGPGNPHNGGGLASAIYVRPSIAPPASPADGVWPEGFLHEMSHTMGAVQFSAPHTSAGPEGARGHCYDGSDVMCYPDGLSPTVAYDPTVCPRAASGPMRQLYDCNGDDYFNPSPAPTSYLATHWNLWDSVFYGSCSTQAPACGTAPDAPPANVAVPRLSGAPTVGSTVTADNGTWAGNPTAYTVAWQRSAAGGGPFSDIPGEKAAAYVVQAQDAGRQVRAVVTATNANGSGTASSAALSAAPVPEEPAPVNSAPPTGGGATSGSSQPPAQGPIVLPAGGASSAVQGPGTAPAVTEPAAATRRTLTLRRRGRTVLRLPLSLTSRATMTRVEVLGRRVALRSGRYRLRVCAAGVCRTRVFTATRGHATLPRMVLNAAPGGRVTATLSARSTTATGTVAPR